MVDSEDRVTLPSLTGHAEADCHHQAHGAEGYYHHHGSMAHSSHAGHHHGSPHSPHEHGSHTTHTSPHACSQRSHGLFGDRCRARLTHKKKEVKKSFETQKSRMRDVSGGAVLSAFVDWCHAKHG